MDPPVARRLTRLGVGLLPLRGGPGFRTGHRRPHPGGGTPRPCTVLAAPPGHVGCARACRRRASVPTGWATAVLGALPGAGLARRGHRGGRLHMRVFRGTSRPQARVAALPRWHSTIRGTHRCPRRTRRGRLRPLRVGTRPQRDGGGSLAHRIGNGRECRRGASPAAVRAPGGSAHRRASGAANEFRQQSK